MSIILTHKGLLVPSRRAFLRGAAGALITAPAIIKSEGAWAQVGQNPSWPPNKPASSGVTNFVFDQTGNQNFGAGQGAGGSYSVPIPALTANTLVVLAFIEFGGTGFVGTVQDLNGLLYTNIGQDGNQGGLWYGFYNSSQGASTVGVNILSGCSNACYVFASFTGVSLALLDSGGTFVQGGASIPTWTTTVAKTLSCGAVGPNNGNLATSPPPSGWASLGATGLFLNLVYKITSAPLSAESMHDNSGGYFMSVITAFK